MFIIWLLFLLVKILNIVIFFWRACLSLGHGQVDREHSLQVGLSVTFPKVQVANIAVNESKHKGNMKKVNFGIDCICCISRAESEKVGVR